MLINPQEIPAEVQQAKLRLGIVGNAPSLTAAIKRAIQVAPIDLSVLIYGESGTGKEFFPKIIHNFSARKHNKYIAVNCGAIPEGTIDSELFGHEKGSFTGAVASRKGYFEEADGGTIFLDEVAELPLTTQARLLRVLETGEFIKVGSSQVQKTNIRIVAATNVDMIRAVEAGRFREDLYYRLSTVTITVPPLRDRGGDIMLLARKFAADFAERYHMPLVSFNDAARHLLLSYRWPGNVRQLKNVIEQLSLFEAGNEISADTLQHYLPAGANIYAPTIAGARANDSETHSYSAERDILFNMIFRLQHEIQSLKETIARSNEQKLITLPEHEHDSDATTKSIVKYTPTMSPVINVDSPEPVDTVEAQPAGMTLEDTEKETIRRSLERNMGRRKATAQELNISERTLYRKIREYGLDNILP